MEKKKHFHKKESHVYHSDKPAHSGIALPKELLDMYESLPSKREQVRAEKQKAYVGSLSEEDLKKYYQASKIARVFQSKYAFVIDGKKHFPFTFNFKSARWTITWDKEWYTESQQVPVLVTGIKELIKSIDQLAPRAKDKDGKDIVLSKDGEPVVYKTNFSADNMFERK